MSELNINIEFYKNVDIIDLKEYVSELKIERDILKSKINNHTVNTIFESGLDATIKKEIEVISNKISKLYDVYILKKNNRL